MPDIKLERPEMGTFQWMGDTADYLIDSFQRTILFWDVMRKRGNAYLGRNRTKDPVLIFDYEIVVDGRKLQRPVNYGLVRIVPPKGIVEDPKKRPIIVIDPRAGHGPGIGGSKRDSQIGMALQHGHPVYFVGFVTKPIPDQTIADVDAAQAVFLDTVKKLHPDAEDNPAVIGNCQAGWAVALLGSQRPDITGPLMLNGAPMSFWAGEAGSNPMTVAGGLSGGAWVISWLSDLGNGTFDGAYLVTNFENLNLANTLWTKQYNLYDRIDTEEPRYLNFEKWWNAYFMMEAEEISFIVNKLFIGNELEQGTLELDSGDPLDLKNIKNPVVIFSSFGDNITPPAQALGWIARVYRSTDEIKRLGKVIVYLLDKDVGHLGIFVSGKIARKQHRELIRHVDILDFFPPGLYEMVIEDTAPVEGIDGYRVRYEERELSDINEVVGPETHDPHFRVVEAVSDFNDKMYKTFVRPWVTLWTTPVSAKFLKHTNPARVSRYAFSDRHPMAPAVESIANWVRANRHPAHRDNLLVKWQQEYSQSIEQYLERIQTLRDGWQQFAYEAIYGNPLLEWALLGMPKGAPGSSRPDRLERARFEEAESDRRHWLSLMEEGGFVEGIVRVIIALTWADLRLDSDELSRIQAFFDRHAALSKVKRTDLKRIAREQSRILQVDPDRAIETLAKLLSPSPELQEAVELAEEIGFARAESTPEEIELANKIRKVLNLDTLAEGHSDFIEEKPAGS